jgi:UDP-N-acetyl-D-mannosaminuronate dehydrogenase
MIDAAHEINVQMPVHVVGNIADALNSVWQALQRLAGAAARRRLSPDPPIGRSVV